MSEKIIELKPLIDSTEEYDALEKRLKELFKEAIYLPLIRELGLDRKRLDNAKSDYENLVAALRAGRITFFRGVFAGRFSASTSKELKRLGARWDRRQGRWAVPLSSLPQDLRAAITSSENYFQEKIAGIDKKLAQILPEQIAGRVKVSDVFERALFKTDKSFRASVKAITITPELTKDQAKRIADEWQNNMQLSIQDFTDKEIVKLRKGIQKAVFTGNRYESVISAIEDSFEGASSKAKFLARQETSLLMAKYKQVRYQEAGISEYRWGCVSGTKLHPVRAAHKKLEGKIISWDNPPITSEPGQPERRNHPKQDYNCRCFARPIMRSK